jgi:hypothetical protein
MTWHAPFLQGGWPGLPERPEDGRKPLSTINLKNAESEVKFQTLIFGETNKDISANLVPINRRLEESPELLISS